jgi:hypothetical protein
MKYLSMSGVLDLGGRARRDSNPQPSDADSSVGVLTRSDRFVTSCSSLPVVHVGPEQPRQLHKLEANRPHSKKIAGREQMSTICDTWTKRGPFH